MDGPHRVEYIFDASSWISIEKDLAQNLILSKILDLVAAGRAYCPPEAWEEVRNCPQVRAWLSQYEDSVVKKIAHPEYFRRIGQVTHRFPSMSGARGRKNRADPYLVGMASFLNDTSNPTVHIVVSEESALKRPSRKISTACDEFGVQHLNLWQVLRKESPNEPWSEE